MVAGAGGGAEWNLSIGGNGGGLEADPGITMCNPFNICPDVITKGGTQTKGGFSYTPYSKGVKDGAFGYVQYFEDSMDNGGFGGNGYYSGATTDYTGAGGGGSSFVSGYEGCIALAGEDNETMSETNSSIHYSGYFFESPSIQKGNLSMPLYYTRNSHGIGNNGPGCIRITILTYKISCKFQYISNLFYLLHVFIVISV